jgi:class 3 adenylate cyclase
MFVLHINAITAQTMDKSKDELLSLQYYDLDKIRFEFLKYAPAYAKAEASSALDKIFELQSQGIIRDGIYYIVLVDIVGSTKFAAEFGNIKLSERIKTFVTFSFNALSQSKIKNNGIFLREIGDAVLFIFQHFPDILKWRDNLQKFLDIFKVKDPYTLRTCVHVGEVTLEGMNPITLAVSQTFKMEKTVQANDIVLTDPAYHVAWPTIMRAYHGFSAYGIVELDGFKDPVKLHKLELHDTDDLSRIIQENTVKD